MTISDSLETYSEPKFRGMIRITAILIALGLYLLGTNSLAHATTLVVPSGGDFQGALNIAQCGDTIVLQAGATYQAASGSDKGFVFPAKNCSSYITVQTSNLAGLPADGQRVQMNDAAAMAKIVPGVVGGNTYAAMTFVANSKFWKLIGLEVTTLVGQPYCSVLVDVGPIRCLGGSTKRSGL